MAAEVLFAGERLFRIVPFFPWVRRVYNFNTLVAPAILVVVATAAIARGRRLGKVRMPLWLPVACVAAAILLFLARVYATDIEPNDLRIRSEVIHTPKLSATVRIVHVSDIQSSAVGAYEETAFAWVRSLRPDIVVFTGDMLQPQAPASWETELPKLLRLVGSVVPPEMKFAVCGDTDGNLGTVTRGNGAGLVVLEDAGADVETSGGRVRLYGLTCVSSYPTSGTKGRVADWLRQSPSDDFSVVLGHKPDFVRTIKELPVDLCLAGHTHGGQVRIPFLGPVVTLSGLPKNLSWGFHEVGLTHLNVSAGVGCEHCASLPSIRVNCPPEIVVIDLVPEQAPLPTTGG